MDRTLIDDLTLAAGHVTVHALNEFGTDASRAHIAKLMGRGLELELRIRASSPATIALWLHDPSTKSDMQLGSLHDV